MAVLGPRDEWLERSIRLAQEHASAGEGGPFGAVIVRDGGLVSEGWNQVLSTGDPTAHAEIVAIRRATSLLGARTLEGCVLYTSCEPCPMCFAAAHWARLREVHFAATREDAAAIGFDDAELYDELGRSPASRAVPCIAHARGAARDVMRAWAATPGRIVY